MEAKFLIVNADDLGLSEAVNEGVFAAHEEGIVTSASLMVRQAATAEAVLALSDHPALAVGLHLDLEGKVYESGDELEVLPAAEEFRRQLAVFRALTGRNPTHLDSHHHAHESEPVTAAAEELAAELRVPLRNRTIRHEGSFYGRDAISPEHLIELIRALPPGWTEIGCHPAAGPVPTSSYDAERQIELATLRDPQVRNLLNVTDVRLCSFAQANRA
ncbi:MAG TPA: ChbG/HpnK family deacetylase [Solirubrobacterales bacterium]|nr:ChbG/HpnK family deacetylase [Solirubrobacterales bacterium]